MCRDLRRRLDKLEVENERLCAENVELQKELEEARRAARLGTRLRTIRAPRVEEEIYG